MSKKLKSVAALFLAFVLVFTLAGCGGGGLNGTYVAEDMIGQSITFNGDKVTLSALGIDVTGKYKIEGNKITITYTMLGEEYSISESFSQSGNKINFGGTEFVKK